MIDINSLENLPKRLGIRKSTQLSCKREEEIKTETALDYESFRRLREKGRKPVQLKPWQCNPREVSREIEELTAIR